MVSTKNRAQNSKTKASKASKIPAKKISFSERYEQCKEFLKKNGHCKIPTSNKENPSLGIWVQEMRRNFKLMMTGKKPRKVLDQEVIAKLNEIFFHWGFQPDPNKFPELDASWEKNFEALKEYHESNGNFDAPITGDLMALGKWVRVQRTQKYYRDTKRKCFITKDRIKMLNGVGFNWKGPRKIDE